jgi:hypothetical protein
MKDETKSSTIVRPLSVIFTLGVLGALGGSISVCLG